MSDHIRIAPSACIECGRKIDAIGSMDGITPHPEPGSPIICLRCGAVMTIDANGAPCGFTDQQMTEIIADTETMNEIARLVRRVHFLRHATN